jgi:hypothetical protein
MRGLHQKASNGMAGSLWSTARNLGWTSRSLHQRVERRTGYRRNTEGESLCAQGFFRFDVDAVFHPV